jgi:DNA polymerase-3 subunit epsilon
MRLALVDVETTGLDPKKHRVLEVAIEIVDATPKGIHVVNTLEFRHNVNLAEPCWEPAALAVNGYHEEHPDWKGAPNVHVPEDQDGVRWNWVHVAELTHTLPLCSQNVPFDRDFMAAEMARVGVKPTWARRFVDLQSFSFMACLETGREKFALHDVYKALGGPDLQEHRAVADVARGKYLLAHALKRYFHDVK